MSATLSTALFCAAAIYINSAEQPSSGESLTVRAPQLKGVATYKRATWMQAPLAIVGFIAGGVWFLGGDRLWLIAGLLIGR